MEESKNLEQNLDNGNEKLHISDVMNSALDWWHNLPFERYNRKDQYTYATKYGFGDREVGDISDEEILTMYKEEHYT